MNDTSDNLTIIGDCANEIEAKLIKGFFESNDIFCYIQGESHRSLMGMMGGFIHLNIMVRESQAEEAAKLLEDFRSHENQHTELDISVQDFQESEPKNSAQTPITRHKPLEHEPKNKRVGIAMLLSLFVTFGTGHLYVREYFTFIVLGLLEALGLMFYFLNYTGYFIPVLVLGPIVFDFVDSVRIAKKGNFKPEWD